MDQRRALDGRHVFQDFERDHCRERGVLERQVAPWLDADERVIPKGVDVGARQLEITGQKALGQPLRTGPDIEHADGGSVRRLLKRRNQQASQKTVALIDVLLKGLCRHITLMMLTFGIC